MKKQILYFILLLFFSVSVVAQEQQPVPVELKKLIDGKDASQINKILDSLVSTDKEANLNLLISFYTTKRNPAKIDSIRKLAIQKFPNGFAAFDALSDKIYYETDPVKNEANYKQLISQFGKVPELAGHKYFDFSRHFVALTFRNNPKKVIYYLNLVQDSLYKTQSYSYAARETYARKEYALAETLIRKAITEESNRNSEKTPAYYAYAKQLAAVLYANSKFKEGLKYAREVKEADKKEDKPFDDTFLKLLISNKQYKDAYPLIVARIKEGTASAEIKGGFRNAYVAEKGTDDGFTEFEAELYASLKAKLRADLEKKMVREPATNFSLKDLNGQLVSLADLKGKIVILDFWATWCAPCKASFPAMQMAVNKYEKDPNVKFLFIHTWEKTQTAVKDARDYIKANNYNFQVLMDLKDPVTKINKTISDYKVKGIPAKFVIDGNGDIRFQLMGFDGSNEAAVEELSMMIDMIKSGK
ncbi:TlpA family protein disulfide reductase [Pedobacter sp. MC2016-14]|uniref:TlpA family protein disulfide reductase n=1 Tax=Pedobacter sp. MC2016-14 TaxID=2897327 RepID=UPI001E55AE82|nr:TlpA disulfide reductase family protein [Pedobacter sp. MC2016-14]MCD0488649.1 TlpA family protein disulfide reductase [Pedobacter sp. MC2016-14]